MIHFRIDIHPPRTTAQGKRAVNLPGKGIRFFKTRQQSAAETTYAALVYPHRPSEPMQGPIGIRIRFVMPWRKSEPKRNRAHGWRWHTTRPDVDNMAKALIDVMGQCGFWGDDSQLASICLEKHWGDKIGVEVVCQNLAEASPAGAQSIFNDKGDTSIASKTKTHQKNA